MSVRANVVFCDDIRTEHNGKAILIGVYTESIAVPTFPASFALSYWIQISGDIVGSHRFRVEIKRNEIEQLLQIEGDLEVIESPASMMFGPAPMTIPEKSLISVWVFLDDGQKIEAGSVKIISAKQE